MFCFFAIGMTHFVPLLISQFSLLVLYSSESFFGMDMNIYISQLTRQTNYL